MDALNYINPYVCIINKLYKVSYFLEVPHQQNERITSIGDSVAITAANTCGPLQRLKVKRQWANAYGSGIDRANFGNFVWAELVMIE